MSFEPDPGQPASSGPEDSAKLGSLFASGGLSLKAVENTKVETQKLVDAAKSGGFKITEKGVKPMRDALREVRTKLNELHEARFTLSQAPMLGDHAYGHAVAAHDRKGATNEDGSATVVLEQLVEVIKQADEALVRAAGIYDETEHRAEDVVKGLQN